MIKQFLLVNSYICEHTEDAVFNFKYIYKLFSSFPLKNIYKHYSFSASLSSNCTPVIIDYTQSGNGHFLAYIPLPFTLSTITYKVVVYAPA